jgi:hypothetical protein
MSADDLSPTQIEALREAWLCLSRNETARADAILVTLPWALGPVQNMRGVSMLRQGQTKTALKIFRSLVFPTGGVVIDTSCPVAWQANFVVALLLSDNLDGFLAHVQRIQPQDHPLATRLREVVAQWRARMSGWRKWRWKILGGAPPESLELDFTIGWSEDFLMAEEEAGAVHPPNDLSFRSTERPVAGAVREKVESPARAAPGHPAPLGFAGHWESPHLQAWERHRRRPDHHLKKPANSPA